MPHSTRARRRPAAGRRPRPSQPDPCPLCTSDLGLPERATRRVIVWTAEPGVFVWRCPDCGGAWTEDASGAVVGG